MTEDGWRLAIHHRPAAAGEPEQGRRYREPLLLCHGLAANRYTFDFEPPHSLAHHLAAEGFDCYTVELRGTGASAAGPLRLRSFSVDDHVDLDAPALIRTVLERSGADRLFWLGHSLGGLIGYAAAQGPQAPRFAGLLALGSPTHFAYRPWLLGSLGLGRLLGWPFSLRQRLLSLTLAPFLGHVTLPLSDVVMNPRHIPPPLQRKVYAHLIESMGRGVLAQLLAWSTTDTFRSKDGRRDHRAGLTSLKVPLLVMGGACDLLSPPSTTQRQFELAGSDDKTLMIFGRSNGDALDYGHGDLLFGSGAPTEIYPRIARWLKERATPFSR